MRYTVKISAAKYLGQRCLWQRCSQQQYPKDTIFIIHTLWNAQHYTECVLSKVMRLNPHCQVEQVFFWPSSYATSQHPTLLSTPLFVTFSAVSPGSHSPAPCPLTTTSFNASGLSLASPFPNHNSF